MCVQFPEQLRLKISTRTLELYPLNSHLKNWPSSKALLQLMQSKAIDIQAPWRHGRTLRHHPSLHGKPLSKLLGMVWACHCVFRVCCLCVLLSFFNKKNVYHHLLFSWKLTKTPWFVNCHWDDGLVCTVLEHEKCLWQLSFSLGLVESLVHSWESIRKWCDLVGMQVEPTYSSKNG